MVVSVHAAAETVEFKIVAATGIVAFTVPEHWGVLGVKSLPPVASAGFQVPDPAADASSDSSNVAVNIYHLDTDQGRAGAAQMGESFGGAPEVGDYKGWTTYTSAPNQGGATYTLLDAKRSFEDQKIEVGVRCAWPHLAAHPAGFDDQMLGLCHALLDSVAETPGPYTPQPDEIVRRPPPPAAPAG